MLSDEDTKRYAAHLKFLAAHGEYEMDGQTFWRTPSWYLPFLDIHEVCHDKMEEVCGMELEPAYCYARRYWPGSYLFPHTDRPECRASLTICLEYGGANYPIWAGTPENQIYLEPGDAIIYNGADVEHGREYMRLDQSYMYQVFVHFMPLSDSYKYLQHEGMMRMKRGDTTATKLAAGVIKPMMPIIDA